MAASSHPARRPRPNPPATTSTSALPPPLRPSTLHNRPQPPPPTAARKPSLLPPAPASRRERVVSSASASSAPAKSRQQLQAPSSLLQGLGSTPDEAVEGMGAVVAAAAPGDKGSTPTEGGTNIEVVVRCRGRSPKEIADNSPIIVSTSGAVGPSLTVELTPISTSSSLSLLAAPTASAAGAPTRTYTFDRVFGPEASQRDVWDEVVGETLGEVLDGYNCTIFAYGQTGTGKTYTMQGDLSPTTLGNPSSEAGIVPRTLHRLFTSLATTPNLNPRDSSVRVSYVEIYNEEIRDLLAPPSSFSSAAAAGGSSSTAGQPMAAGGPGPKELKIYEDPSPKGRGVVIQGLEEVGVRTAGQAIELLRKGSARRETGETLMNATSSRSHSIFSITVHVKETSSTGEDLLKVGKLNLVDLAGSENIGRSGAVEGRAREAGMINQSLLTLGRVINSLVKKSSHVPYRESKLTRLLQDSLGGRTKTRIIATISPSRSNLEETLSTIDYATRATRILCRPEVNQRMTRNGLIGEYVAEIEGLKKDLLAAREKNGIYITAEDYAQLNEDAKLHATQLDEAKSRHVILSNRLSALGAELEETSVRLLTTEDSRRALKAALDELAAELEVERRAVELFEQGEERVDGVARAYRGALDDATGDLDGLFAKKDRTTSVLAANASAGTTHATRTLAATDGLAELASRFARAHADGLGAVSDNAGEFKRRRVESNQALSAALTTGSTAFGSSTAQVEKYLDRAHVEGVAYRAEVGSAREAVERSLAGQSEGVKQGLVTHEAALRAAVSESLGETRRVADALGGIHVQAGEIGELQAPRRGIIDDKDGRIRSADVEDVDHLAKASTLITSLVASCEQEYATRRSRLGSSLRAQMVAFQQQQQQQAIAFQESLMALHESEMDDLQAAHARSLAEIGQALRAVQEDKQARAQAQDAAQRALTARLHAADEQVMVAADGIKTLGQSLQADLTEAVSQTEDSVASGLSALTEHAVELIDGESAKIAAQLAAIAKASDAAGAVADKTLKKQRFALKTSRNGVDELLRAVEDDLREANVDVETCSASILSSLSTLDASLTTYTTAHASAVVALRESTTSFQQTGLREDEPTGATPRKRAWDHVPSTWERTGTLAQVKDRLRAAATTEAKAAGGGASTSGTVSPNADEGDA